ncbi:ABC transporter ATP-binding protein/permease [Deltaproteobacteria bacterium]|nr:ABC transporter ATP-binding protein/permease [Deltaproteobacteria bacterium]
MIISSLSEVVSIGAILPFIGILTAPEQIYQHHLIQPIVQYFELTSSSQLMLPLTIAFILSALLAGALRLTLLYATTRLSFAAGADLSINIYRRTLYQDYSVHVLRNSSEVINGIISKTNTVIGGVLNPILILISSLFFLIGIISALIVINILVAITASIGFGVLYWGVIRFTRQQLKDNSKCIADQSTQMIKSLQEGLGGIRDVLIDGSQQFYCDLYRTADFPLRRASGNNVFIAGSPRYAMEAIGMAMIAILAYITTQQESGLVSAIPVLGALALGAQRLLPSLQQAYSAYSTLKGSKSSFEDVLSLLDQPLPIYVNQALPAPALFKKEIQLNNLNFRYTADITKNTPWVLKNINLKLAKGSRIGFMGATGSGKSTLLDIIMGLLPPTSGELTVDGQSITTENRRSWQANIAHVPQNIYLSDSSIEENIAFGIPKERINHEQVEQAAKLAQIADLIEDWQEGYQTFVGERGIRLSGGQRQRLGIARALYKQANILIFDEATSALDNETEQAVMEAIEGLGRELTILIIAHRLTTLKGCDQIVKLDKNNIIHTGSFKEMIQA